MISDVASYLNKLQEIQNSNLSTIYLQTPDEPRFIIDANARTITVPTLLKNVGVENDHNAETIYFEIDRYFDNEDLNNHICVIHYINANNSPDVYPVVLKDLSTEGKLIFGWTITNHVTQVKGNVSFAVRFYTLEDDGATFKYNWNTTISSFNILEGMDVSGIIGTVEADILSKAVEGINNVLTSATITLEGLQEDATIAKSTIEDAVLSTRMIYKEPVSTFDELSTTYPDAKDGWVSKVIGDSKIYRFSDGNWEWVDTVSLSTYDSLYSLLTTSLNNKIQTYAYTASSTVSSITHNLDYNLSTDNMEIFCNGVLLDENDNYTNSVDYKTINLTDWTIPSGTKVYFKLFKNVV